MPLAVSSIHIAQWIAIVQHFDHEGVCQLQNSFVRYEDLHSQNIVQLQSTVLSEMLDTITDMTSVSQPG